MRQQSYVLKKSHIHGQYIHLEFFLVFDYVVQIAVMFVCETTLTCIKDMWVVQEKQYSLLTNLNISFILFIGRSSL